MPTVRKAPYAAVTESRRVVLFKLLGKREGEMTNTETKPMSDVDDLIRIAAKAMCDDRPTYHKTGDTLLTMYARSAVEALRPYLTQRPVDLEWQPIETAYRGELVLVCGGVAQSACSGNDDWFENTEVYIAKQYHGDTDYTVNDYFIVRPTHWMPLPKPPATQTPYTEKGGR